MREIAPRYEFHQESATLVFRVGSSSLPAQDRTPRGAHSAQEFVLRLRASLGAHLDASVYAELNSLSGERDSEMFFEGLFQFGQRLEADDRIEAAGAVYQAIVQARPPLPAFGHPLPQGERGNQEGPRQKVPSPPVGEGQGEGENAALNHIQNRAEQRLAVLNGGGPSGLHSEYLLRRLSKETLEPTTLFGFGLASVGLRTVRLATLSRLASTPTANLLTRGIGAQMVAGFAGASAEAALFPFAVRGAALALGRDLDWSYQQLGKELGSSFLLLGAMRLTGGAVSGLNRQAPGFLGRGAGIANQAAMLGGIALGLHAETAAGLRNRTDGSTLLMDSLATWLQVNAAGRVMRGVMGEGFTAWERAMDVYTEALGRGLHPTVSLRGAERRSNPLATSSFVTKRLLRSFGPRNDTGGALQNPNVFMAEVERIETGGTQTKEPQFHYPPEVEAAWKHVEERFRDPTYYEGNREALARKRPDPDALDEIWLYQAADYFRRLGYESEIVDIADFAVEKTNAGGPRMNAELLERALSALGERGQQGSLARKVVRVCIEENCYSRFRSDDPDVQYLMIPPIMDEVEGVLPNQVTLLERTPEGMAHIDILSFSMVETLYRITPGYETTQIHPVPGAPPRDLVMSLRARGVSPGGFGRGLIYYHHSDYDIHPFPFGAHDTLFHAARDATFSLLHRSLVGWFYRRFQNVLPDGKLKGTFLDMFSNLDFPVGFGIEFSGFAAAIFRPLEIYLSEVQYRDTFQERRAGREELRESIAAIRALVENEFYREPDLAGGEAAFLSELDTWTRYLRRVDEIAEATHALGAEIPPPAYSAHMLALLDEIEARFRDPTYLEGSREDLLRKRVDIRLADQLWFRQGMHYANLIPDAEWRMEDAEILLQTPSGQEGDVDRVLFDAVISRLGNDTEFGSDARQVLVIEMPPGKVMSTVIAEHPHLQPLVDEPHVVLLQEALGGRLYFCERCEDRNILRIPSLTLIEKLLQVRFGEDRAQLHFVPGIIPRDVVARLRGMRVSPVALAFGPIYTEDTQGPVDPFFVTQHDAVQHAADDAANPEGISEFSSWLYAEIQRTMPDFHEKEALLERFANPHFQELEGLSSIESVAHHLLEPLNGSLAEMRISRDPVEIERSVRKAHALAEFFEKFFLENLPRSSLSADQCQILTRIFEETRRLLPPLSVVSSLKRKKDPVPPIDYPPDIQEVWEEIAKAFRRKDYYDGDHIALRRKRPDEELVDRLWLFQGERYLRSLPELNLDILDAELLLETRGRTENREHREIVQRALKLLGERGRPDSLARKVLVLTVPNDWTFDVALATIWSGEAQNALLLTAAEMERRTGGRLSLVSSDKDEFRIFLPTLSLIERLLQVAHGADRVQLHYVLGNIPRDIMMSLRKRRAPAIGLSDQPLFLGDLEEEVDPFLYALHDGVNHAVMDAAAKEGVPEFYGRLYQYFRDRFTIAERPEGVLNNLSDLEQEFFDDNYLNGIGNSFIYAVGSAYQRLETIDPKKRRGEIEELERLSNTLQGLIHSQLPPLEKQPEGTQATLKKFREWRRRIRAEYRALSKPRT